MDLRVEEAARAAARDVEAVDAAADAAGVRKAPAARVGVFAPANGPGTGFFKGIQAGAEPRKRPSPAGARGYRREEGEAGEQGLPDLEAEPAD